MRKKIIGTISVLFMSLLVTACAAKTDEPGTTAATTEAATEATTEAASEEVSSETEETTEAPVEAPNEASGDLEDGQNPFMNFIGTYASGDMTIFIECKGSDEAKFTVNSSNSENESSEWTMTVKWSDDLKMSYSDGMKKTFTFSEDGDVTESTDYEGGSGTFTFDGSTCTWKDDKENIADGMIFDYQLIGGAPDEAGE